MEHGAGFTSVNASRFTNGNRAEHVHIELYMRAYTNGKAGRARAQGRREQRSHATKERTESTQASRERTSVQGAERTSRTRGHREEIARGRVEREPARPTHARHALGEREKRLISERVEREPRTRERATEGRGVQREQAPIMRPRPARLASPTHRLLPRHQRCCTSCRAIVLLRHTWYCSPLSCRTSHVLDHQHLLTHDVVHLIVIA